ncbi:MAG: VCBS repeat-containing protein [Verrucomicrobiales bacterium]
MCAYNADSLATDDRSTAIAHAGVIVYHDANSGAPNTLFRNDGGWQFRDATKEAGMDANNRRYSFAAAWEDFDNDGDQDLYVANDFGRNCLYRNDGGAFVEVGAETGASDRASGMSVSWGDPDRDGNMDLYVANMFSSAGGRITTQDGFKADAPGVREALKRFADGNRLLKNAGGRFADVSPQSGTMMGRWAWGRSSPTSTTTAGRTSRSPTATSRRRTTAICEASSGARSWRRPGMTRATARRG